MKLFPNLLILALTLAIFTTTACQKKVHKIDDDFVGTWTTTGPDAGDWSTLDIDDHGNATYEEYQDGVRVEYSKGPARLIDDLLKVGPRSSFRVTQFPTTEPTDDLNFNPSEEYELTMKLEKRFFFKK